MSRPILLVEDEDNDVLFMKIAMQKAGLTIPLQVARDGREAIRYLNGEGQYAKRQEFPLPALVLLDLKLPFVPGFEVLAWIRKQPALAGLPVIVLSTSNLDRDMEQAHRLGASAYIQKPTNPIHLEETVKNLQTLWLKEEYSCQLRPAG